MPNFFIKLILLIKKLANSKKKFGIYVSSNNANNCYHTLSFIALFLQVITFSVNINLHSQLFHQEIVFWLIKNQVLRKDLLFFTNKKYWV